MIFDDESTSADAPVKGGDEVAANAEGSDAPADTGAAEQLLTGCISKN